MKLIPSKRDWKYCNEDIISGLPNLLRYTAVDDIVALDGGLLRIFLRQGMLQFLISNNNFRLVTMVKFLPPCQKIYKKVVDNVYTIFIPRIVKKTFL